MSYQGVEVHPAVPPPRSPGRPVAGAPGLASLGLGGRESAGPDARSGRAGRAGTGSGRGDLPDRDVRAWMQAAAMPGHRVEGTDRCLIGVTDGRGPASPTLHGNVADKCPGIDAQAVLVNPNPVSDVRFHGRRTSRGGPAWPGRPAWRPSVVLSRAPGQPPRASRHRGPPPGQPRQMRTRAQSSDPADPACMARTSLPAPASNPEVTSRSAAPSRRSIPSSISRPGASISPSV